MFNNLVISRARLLKGKAEVVVNVLAFKVGWGVAILLGDLPALAFTVFYLIIHGFFIVKRQQEWLFVAVVVLLGASVDTVLSKLQVLNFADPVTTIPIWLGCIWVLLATSICHALSWFRSQLMLAALFGTVAGPFAYFMGARLSDAFLAQPLWMSMLVYGAVWACLLPFVFYLSRFVYAKPA